MATVPHVVQAGQLLHRHCGTSIVVRGALFALCDMYTVPAGKRLVVEMFSYAIFSDAFNAPPYRVAVGLDQGSPHVVSNVLWFAPVNPVNLTNQTSYADTRAIRLYFDEGQKVQGEADFSGPNHFVQGFQFSGFLTNK